VDDPQPVPRRVYEAPPGFQQLGGYALEVNGKRFLFTGDIEAAGERAVVSEWQRLELGSADVLLATHHGSKYASHDFFLDAVKPKSAVISVNRGHGHPDPEAIHRLRSAGAAIWCTAWNGTVTAIVPAGAAKVRLRSSENSAPWWLRGERHSRGTCVDQVAVVDGATVNPWSLPASS